MADIIENTPEMLAEWSEFLDTLPANQRAVAERIVPWKLYRMKSTGQRVTVVSYGDFDDGSVGLQVNVSSKYNFIATFERNVYGVPADDLEECDLPGRNEPVGFFADKMAELVNRRNDA